MNRYQAPNGGYNCIDDNVNLHCRQCASMIGGGFYCDDVAPIHYDRDHSTPGAHLRVFGDYDTAAYPNPYAYDWRTGAECDALLDAMLELGSGDIAKRLGWREP